MIIKLKQSEYINSIYCILIYKIYKHHISVLQFIYYIYIHVYKIFYLCIRPCVVISFEKKCPALYILEKKDHLVDKRLDSSGMLNRQFVSHIDIWPSIHQHKINFVWFRRDHKRIYLDNLNILVIMGEAWCYDKSHLISKKAFYPSISKFNLCEIYDYYYYYYW